MHGSPSDGARKQGLNGCRPSTYTILAASLAYQFKLDWERKATKPVRIWGTPALTGAQLSAASGQLVDGPVNRRTRAQHSQFAFWEAGGAPAAASAFIALDLARRGTRGAPWPRCRDIAIL